jgi:hypothetical protein
MNTIATEEQTPVVDRAPRRGTNFNLRAYFAGGAATVALIAAGIVIFGSLAAYVAFNGVPVGGGDEGGDSVAVETAGAGAPGGATLGAAPGAVAATAATATAIAPAAAGGAGAPGATAPPSGGTIPPGTTPPDTTTPGTGTTPIPGGTGTDTGTGTDATGPVGSAVQGVDDTAAGAGADLPLAETTDPITGPADETVQDTIDQVGGAIGQPDLGHQVGGTVSGLTDKLPPPG